MEFSQLRINEYVRLNPKLKEHLLDFPFPQLFEDEPDCVLQVKDLVDVGDAGMATLECTMGCGNHGYTAVTTSDYDDFTGIIGESFLVQASINEIISLMDEKSAAQESLFDAEKESLFFEELLSKNG